MQLFAALRKIRGFERERLPYLKAVVDFDIIVEIGYADELNRPLTPKQLFLLNLGSITTVRRKLAKLEAQGMVTRRANVDDRRSAFLSITSSSLKMLGRYGRLLTRISVMD